MARVRRGLAADPPLLVEPLPDLLRVLLEHGVRADVLRFVVLAADGPESVRPAEGRDAFVATNLILMFVTWIPIFQSRNLNGPFSVGRSIKQRLVGKPQKSSGIKIADLSPIRELQ